MRSLEDCSDRHGELLTAFLRLAFVNAGASRLALELHNYGRAAVWAYWTVRPVNRFKVFAGLFFCKGGNLGEIHKAPWFKMLESYGLGLGLSSI